MNGPTLRDGSAVTAWAVFDMPRLPATTVVADAPLLFGGARTVAVFATEEDALLGAQAPKLLDLAIRTEAWTSAVENAEIARGERHELSQFVLDLRAAIAAATGAPS